MCTSLSTNSLSRSSRSRSRDIRAIWSIRSRSGEPPRSNLEAQAALARRIRERLDATVVEIAAAIEHHFLDALGGSALGERLADHLGGIDVRSGFSAFADGLFQRRGG